MRKQGVVCFYGYTRMTGRFQGHLYFTHTYEPSRAPPGLSIYPGAPRNLDPKRRAAREVHLTDCRQVRE
jgi:hypothetical protein